MIVVVGKLDAIYVSEKDKKRIIDQLSIFFEKKFIADSETVFE